MLRLGGVCTARQSSDYLLTRADKPPSASKFERIRRCLAQGVRSSSGKRFDFPRNSEQAL